MRHLLQLIKMHFCPPQFEATRHDNIMFAEVEDGISILVASLTSLA